MSFKLELDVPSRNGYAESFVASIKRECINHRIFFGENSLRKAVTEYVQHYHFERTHQGLDNNVPLPKPAPTLVEDALIVKSERLGGLLNYYHRENPPDSIPKFDLTTSMKN